MTWYYKNEEFEPEESFLEDYQGFVYLLTDQNGMKYIGKKFFWKPKILPVTKTRKRRKKTRVQSDWRDYYGSSAEVKLLIERGDATFQREILRLCRTKGECSYFEAKYQFEHDVLLRDDSYLAPIHI